MKKLYLALGCYYIFILSVEGEPPNEQRRRFVLTPIRPPQTIEECQGRMLEIAALNSVGEIPNKPIQGRLSVVDGSGFFDFVVFGDTLKSEYSLIVRRADKLGAAHGCVTLPVPPELATIFGCVCDGFLDQTDYSDAASIFAAMDGPVCELANELQAGQCSAVPSDSVFGRFLRAVFAVATQVVSSKDEPEALHAALSKFSDEVAALKMALSRTEVKVVVKSWRSMDSGTETGQLVDLGALLDLLRKAFDKGSK